MPREHEAGFCINFSTLHGKKSLVLCQGVDNLE